jgi:hypothetical protein
MCNEPWSKLHRRGLRRGLTSIKPNAFKALAQDDDFLDVRTPQEFTIPILGLGLDGQFAPWVVAPRYRSKNSTVTHPVARKKQ